MTTSQLTPSNRTGKWMRALVLITCIGATNPSYSKGFDLFEDGALHRKRAVHSNDLMWESSSFRISGQRVSHTTSGWDPDDDLDFEVNVKAIPVKEFSVKANIVSVEEYKPRVFIEDIYFED